MPKRELRHMKTQTSMTTLRDAKPDKKTHTCKNCKWYIKDYGGWCTNYGKHVDGDRKSHCGRYKGSSGGGKTRKRKRTRKDNKK